MRPSEATPYPRGFRASPSSQHTRWLTAPSWQPRPDAVRTRADQHQKGAVSGCEHEDYVYTAKPDFKTCLHQTPDWSVF